MWTESLRLSNTNNLKEMVGENPNPITKTRVIYLNGSPINFQFNLKILFLSFNF